MAQETLLAVWQGADSFQGHSTLSTWVYSIALYKERGNHRRVKSRMIKDRESLEDPTLKEEPSHPEDILIEFDERADKLKAVWLAVDHALSAELKETFLLVFKEGLNYRDVAQRLGIPEGTVKSRMFYGIQRVREAVADKFQRSE